MSPTSFGCGRPEEGRQLASAAQPGEDRDLVLPAVPLGDRVLLPGALPRQSEEFAQPVAVALGPPGVAERLALHDQQPVEIQERIGQQRLSLEGEELRGFFACRGIAPLQPLAQLGQTRLVGIQPAKVLLAFRILLAERLAQILDRQTHCGAVHLIEGVSREPACRAETERKDRNGRNCSNRHLRPSPRANAAMPTLSIDSPAASHAGVRLDDTGRG